VIGVLIKIPCRHKMSVIVIVMKKTLLLKNPLAIVNRKAWEILLFSSFLLQVLLSYVVWKYDKVFSTHYMKPN
jgi:hypothetical protein